MDWTCVGASLRPGIQSTYRGKPVVDDGQGAAIGVDEEKLRFGHDRERDRDRVPRTRS